MKTAKHSELRDHLRLEIHTSVFRRNDSVKCFSKVTAGLHSGGGDDSDKHVVLV